MAETKHKIQQLPADRKKKALRTIGFAALNIAIIAYIALREFGSGSRTPCSFPS